MNAQEITFRERLVRNLNRCLSHGELPSYKNYPDFCNSFNLPVKQGADKPTHVRYLKCFCDLHKTTGHKMQYSEVYRDVDYRILEEKPVSYNVAKLLAHEFRENKNEPLIYTQTGFWKLIGFCNENYGVNRKEKRLAKKNIHNPYMCYDFYGQLWKKTEALTNVTMKPIAKRELVNFEHTTVIVYNDPGSDGKIKIKFRPATDEELETIRQITNSLLPEYNCANERQTWGKRRNINFYETRQKALRGALGCVAVSKGYIVTPLYKSWPLLPSGSKKDREKFIKENNGIICDTIEKRIFASLKRQAMKAGSIKDVNDSDPLLNLYFGDIQLLVSELMRIPA